MIKYSARDKTIQKVLNDILEYDGLIPDEAERIALVKGIAKRHFSKKAKENWFVNENIYPIKICLRKHNI